MQIKKPKLVLTIVLLGLSKSAAPVLEIDYHTLLSQQKQQETDQTKARGTDFVTLVRNNPFAKAIIGTTALIVAALGVNAMLQGRGTNTNTGQNDLANATRAAEKLDKAEKASFESNLSKLKDQDKTILAQIMKSDDIYTDDETTLFTYIDTHIKAPGQINSFQNFLKLLPNDQNANFYLLFKDAKNKGSLKNIAKFFHKHKEAIKKAFEEKTPKKESEKKNLAPAAASKGSPATKTSEEGEEQTDKQGDPEEPESDEEPPVEQGKVEGLKDQGDPATATASNSQSGATSSPLPQPSVSLPPSTDSSTTKTPKIDKDRQEKQKATQENRKTSKVQKNAAPAVTPADSTTSADSMLQKTQKGSEDLSVREMLEGGTEQPEVSTLASTSAATNSASSTSLSENPKASESQTNLPLADASNIDVAKDDEQTYEELKAAYDNLEADSSVVKKARAAGFKVRKTTKENVNGTSEPSKIKDEPSKIKEVLRQAITNYENRVLTDVRFDIEVQMQKIRKAIENADFGALKLDFFKENQTKDKNIDQLITLLDEMLTGVITNIKIEFDDINQNLLNKKRSQPNRKGKFSLQQDFTFVKNNSKEGRTTRARLCRAVGIVEILSKIKQKKTT